MDPVIKRLKSECARLGGRLLIIPLESYKRLEESFKWVDGSPFSDAPFVDWHGVNWKTKTIYAVRGHESVNAIIHEMGHIFADSNDPDHASEWDWLGWEICMAKHARCWKAWDAGNYNYGVLWENVRDWGKLTPKLKDKLTKDRIKHAKVRGLISKSGVPLAIR